MKKLDISLLLVEDDTIIRNIYKQILGQHISILYLASNGEEGYQSYLDNKPDLIISDIKLPIMNGLDMIKKIREVDKSMRIIIMSAYGESRYFIKAIETGVKGFLVKPIETTHLINIIREQANDILLEKRLAEEEVKRLSAEKERDRGEEILRALLETMAKLFNFGFNESTVREVLKLIGSKANVSRAYIFKIYKKNNESVLSQINEWVADDIDEQIDNDALKEIPIFNEEFRSWSDSMSNHQNIMGFAKDFDTPIRTILLEQDIKSILAIPIRVKNNWWGFIGFDDCVNYREWSDAEVNALEMLAYILGGAIFRTEVEEEMTKLNASLEERVWYRTKELEQEIIDRTLAESLLQDSEEKYRHIYENANDGILLFMNNKISLINPKISEIIQLMPKDIIGSNFSSLVKPNFLDKLSSYFDSKIENNEIQVQLLNERWIEIKATTISWDLEPAHLLFISDITKRKNAEEDLNKLNKNLEKRIEQEVKRVNVQQQLLVQKSKLESIGELSAGLAHEINQPLGGISMGLENIIYNITDEGVDSDYLQKKISLLFKDIERIQKIIEHVRLFSRDQEKSIMEVISVNQVVKNALSLVSKQLTDRHIELIVNIPESQIEVIGNQYRLEQVILNIISNARYAVDEKKKRLGKQDFSKRITIDLTKNHSEAIITICDNGIGIDMEIITKIFDPFFTTKSEEKGTGLGLSISYGIISEMKGVIEVESEKGNYTRMKIIIPVK